MVLIHGRYQHRTVSRIPPRHVRSFGQAVMTVSGGDGVKRGTNQINQLASAANLERLAESRHWWGVRLPRIKRGKTHRANLQALSIDGRLYG
jgi:hypothetical protein